MKLSLYHLIINGYQLELCVGFNCIWLNSLIYKNESNEHQILTSIEFHMGQKAHIILMFLHDVHMTSFFDVNWVCILDYHQTSN